MTHLFLLRRNILDMNELKCCNLPNRDSKSISTSIIVPNGFTLIEVSVSLLLILLAALMGARVMVTAIDSYKKSRIGFTLIQRCQSLKQELMSRSFSSDQWQEGAFLKEEGGFRYRWEIKRISDSLKFAELSVKDKINGMGRQTYFYKSKFIKNIKPEFN
jgi:prepilin-type N-terminal cleavage/methylation domain-containing protein